MRALALAALAACSSSSPPRWEWPESTPEEQGLDSTKLEGAYTYAFQPAKYTQGVVIIRHGVLVSERYEDGRDEKSYAASWSMAKSFTSALVGIAIHEHRLSGVDATLAATYPQWAGDARNLITVEHVLHQSTGLMWNEDYDITMANSSDVVQLVFTTADPLDYVLAKPAMYAPDTMFYYSSGNTLLLSGVIAKATGKRAGDYAQEKLFSALDIVGADWWRAKTGETLTYCCVDMTSRDFARFGLLYLQRGKFNGKQVVPESWVDDSLAPAPTFNGYGYQWWLDGATDPTLPPDLYAAEGHDGQFIYVIPSLDLVVVRNGHYDKYPGPAVADPQLFGRYPSNGLTPGGGTIPPDSWSHSQFLQPIISAITN